MLLCRGEGRTESLPSREMFEPGVPNKRQRHCFYLQCPCLLTTGRRGLRAHKELMGNKTLPSFPAQGGLWESPSQISAGRHSQTALLPDKSELRQAEGKPPHKAGSRSVGPPLASYPHTTALACPLCHSHPTAITPNCDSQGLLVERPTSQYWDCGCK